MKTAAIYCRVSTDKQDVECINQIKTCTEYAKRHDIGVFETYVDVYTGTKLQRPNFNRLLKDMREYKFDVIIVTKIDRLGRSLQHLLSLIDEFNSKKVQFVAVTQNIDTTSSIGKMQMQIFGVFAEFERNMISERTKEGLRGKKNVGKRGKDTKPRKARSDRGSTRRKK